MTFTGLSKSAMACGLVLAHSVGHAAQYPLAQTPRNAAVKEPAPNVIVSVDNSGSMAFSSIASEGDKAPPPGTPNRMEALKTALKDNFSTASIPDDRIRLAWQAMNVGAVQVNQNSCVGFFGDTAPGRYRAGTCNIGGRANANLMRSLDGAHRANFMTWVDSMIADGGTPLHAMMTRAGEYMKTSGQYSPYSDDPGVKDATESSCRKSFHIFMTDGDYNLFGFDVEPNQLNMPDIGNEDGTRRVLPDAEVYTPVAPYKDGAGTVNSPAKWKSTSGTWAPIAEYRPTLADMAFHYWASDLQPGIANNLKKVVVEPGQARVGTATVPEYWNAKNDPATWQHLTTHTIGFGAASSWSGAPAMSTNLAQPTYSGGYVGLVEGTIGWRNPLVATDFQGWNSSNLGYFYSNPADTAAVRMDLWHAALNSRGTFTPASNSQALNAAFKSILSQILFNTSIPLTSISANSSRLSTGNAVYQAGYDTADWSGKLTASKFGANARPAGEPDWSARELLDRRMAAPGAHATDRKVLSFSGTAAATATTTATVGSGIPFRWDRLSDAQKTALQGRTGTDTESVAFGNAVLDFLRGDRRNEGAGLRLRQRGHVLGDIVGSGVWYAGQPQSGFTHDGYAAFAATARKPMVYVGANDGMLHAFDAGTGNEAFAYVPEGVYGTPAVPMLKRLSEGTYVHRYFVDGSAFVADAYMGGTAAPTATAAEKAAGWKSLLVGTLGAGGKGYFVLDVTKPESVAEQNAASVVLIDTTALPDRDLGHQFQQPALDVASGRAVQVAKLNNGRTALILGNGYNSASEKAVLWIQYLDGNREVLKIPTSATPGVAAGNGLSAPRPVDRNGDGKPDFVYAGDLLGNMWKFDLSNADSGRWKATMNLAPVAAASAPAPAAAVNFDGVPLFAAGASQPITAAPVVVGHPRGGYMVVFGTGRLFAVGDERTATPHYLYGIWDPANGTSGAAAMADLVAQTAGTRPVKRDAAEYRTVSRHSVSYTGAEARRGWSLQLPAGGERIVYPGKALSNSAGTFAATVPGTSSNVLDCTAGSDDDGWSMVVDFFSGSAPQGIAYNGTGTADAFLGFRNRSGKDDIVFVPQDRQKGKDVICNAAGECHTTTRPDAVRRFGWRNLISTD
ncbi:pilus assembly protein [Variovorax sp. RCC_210]|uniref:pilus assembly protein n=1 Tax=Variovorax sp. RCC_210 TaxID=3239217 RepID=UPI003523D184